MRKICVAYGTNPPDPAEAKFNKLVAEDVAHTLASLGWAPGLTGLRGDSTEPMEEMDVFNLCDGDDKDRFGLVSFAEELESMGCRFTGSSAKILALGKEKTLSWLDPELTPRWWELPPENQQYIAKPRSAHGSLLISPANINGSALSFSPIEYFFQELPEGCELTACFLGREFLGLTVVRATGIISRDDKWDENVLKARKPRVWDWSGETFPQVKAARPPCFCKHPPCLLRGCLSFSALPLANGTKERFSALLGSGVDFAETTRPRNPAETGLEYIPVFFLQSCQHGGGIFHWFTPRSPDGAVFVDNFD